MDYGQKLRFQRKIILGIFVVLLIGPCAIMHFHNTYTDYFYDTSGRYCLAVTQYNAKRNAGIYFSYGRKMPGKPSENYIFLKWTDMNFCYRFAGDTLLLEVFNWNPIEYHIDTNNKKFIVYPVLKRIDMDTSLPLGRRDFYRNNDIEKFSCRSREDLTKNWAFKF